MNRASQPNTQKGELFIRPARARGDGLSSHRAGGKLGGSFRKRTAIARPFASKMFRNCNLPKLEI